MVNTVPAKSSVPNKNEFTILCVKVESNYMYMFSIVTCQPFVFYGENENRLASLSKKTCNKTSPVAKSSVPSSFF